MNEHADSQKRNAEVAGADASKIAAGEAVRRPAQPLGPTGKVRGGPDSTEEGSTMKHCFGVSMGWFMEDLVGDYQERLRCYNCADFDQCYKMSMIKAMAQLRFEVRRAARTVGLAVGGSHSAYPF